MSKLIKKNAEFTLSQLEIRVVYSTCDFQNFN